jgi:hypothetical protein
MAYEFYNAPAREDSITFKLVRYLSNSPDDVKVAGQFFLSPEKAAADRNNLFQNNHLIPNEVRDQDRFTLFFGDLANSNHPSGQHYNQADFKTNGAPMPTSVLDSLRTGISMHSGPHKTYTDFVTARVEEIQTRYDNAKVGDPDGARANALKELRGLQEFMKQA